MLLYLLLLLILILFILLYLVYRPPFALVSYIQRRTSGVIWHADVPTKMLALTLDDGPSASTPALLAVLQAHSARATHFVMGAPSAAHPHTLRALVAASHELGNHGVRDEPAWRLGLAALESGAAATEAQIASAYGDAAAGRRRRFYRPGHGWFTAAMRARLEAMGFTLALGSVYPHDPQVRWPRLSAWHVRAGVRPGAVVILHDRPWTVRTLEILLPALKRDGWQIVTLSELLDAEGRRN